MPRLPAEWEPQAGVIVTWPHSGTDWSSHLEEVERLYHQLSTRILAHEPLLVVARDEAHRAHILSLLPSSTRHPLHTSLAETNDTWIRDYGPITVIDEGRPRELDFTFNAWGGKYPCQRDDRVTRSLVENGLFTNADYRRIDLVLEGGAIETDGRGTLLATERSLVDPSRNPGLDRSELEARLRPLLGVDRFLWLENGQLSGDDTDGHIDTLVRFVAPDALCHLQCDDRSHPDHSALSHLEEELKALRQADGSPYRLIPLPHPSPIRDKEGRLLPASYANFLIINGAVLLPVYGDPADRAAAAVLRRCFPGRRIVPLDCHVLITQKGALHCATMQLPACVHL